MMKRLQDLASAHVTAVGSAVSAVLEEDTIQEKESMVGFFAVVSSSSK